MKALRDNKTSRPMIKTARGALDVRLMPGHVLKKRTDREVDL